MNLTIFPFIKVHLCALHIASLFPTTSGNSAERDMESKIIILNIVNANPHAVLMVVQSASLIQTLGH